MQVPLPLLLIHHAISESETRLCAILTCEDDLEENGFRILPAVRNRLRMESDFVIPPPLLLRESEKRNIWARSRSPVVLALIILKRGKSKRRVKG